MIDKEKITLEWIEKISKANRNADKILVEKVIRALLLLEGLEKLSEKYPLFLLSNCEEGGLVNFMKHTRTTHLFTDYMEHGQNLKPKSFNLRLLKERNQLTRPVYIGDTDGDSKACIDAGVPFVFMTYGFGKTDNYELKFDSFSQLTDYFLKL